MRRLASALLAVGLGALVLVGGGGARSAKVVTVQLNDLVGVVGTQIVCEAQVGKTSLKGKKLVGCLPEAHGQPIAGSYAPALGDDGTLVVVAVTKAGVAKSVFTRRPAAVRRGQRVVRVGVGDQILVAGTELACAVENQRGEVVTTCFRLDRATKKPPAHSYGFAIANTFAAAVSFDSGGQPKVIYFRRQP